MSRPPLAERGGSGSESWAHPVSLAPSERGRDAVRDSVSHRLWRPGRRIVGHRVGVAILEIMTGKPSPKDAMEACNANLVNIAKRGGGKINEADLIKN